MGTFINVLCRWPESVHSLITAKHLSVVVKTSWVGMCWLKRGNHPESRQPLDRFSRNHFEMFDSVSSIGLWAICLDCMLESVEGVVDCGVTNGMNGDLHVERIGEIHHGV
jgi:hypothetical protein